MNVALRLTSAIEATGMVPTPPEVLEAFVAPFGLYLHVPFCRSICPFCPYSKVLLRPGLASPYFAALRHELELYDTRSLRFDSLYVGGGTPSLCLEELAPVLAELHVDHERAIEVLPTHATPGGLARIRALGFNYVSLGIQSFDDRMLRHLGRLNTADENRLALEQAVGAFSCVNADLIFDVAFAEPDVFLRDFEACCRAGVDQISTYPLMHFGYTPFGKLPHAPRAEHDLLRRTCALAADLGYERRSVWTFNRVDGPLYASIAREAYLGCGAGAATFTGRDFLVNHFGLAPYERALAEGRLPLARRARLTPRPAAAYYAFWQLYAPGIDVERFRRLFPGASAVPLALEALRRLGLLEQRGGRLHLTDRGFDRYHDLERWVTYHLIEPLWEEMLQEHPAPDRPRTRARRWPEGARGSRLGGRCRRYVARSARDAEGYARRRAPGHDRGILQPHESPLRPREPRAGATARSERTRSDRGAARRAPPAPPSWSASRCVPSERPTHVEPAARSSSSRRIGD